MPLLLVLVLVVLGVIALIPISIIQRYRMGTARQRARGWLIGLNVAGLLLSVALFLVSAAFTTIWVPGAFTYTAAGLSAGAVLGIVGLWLTRWEPGLDALHFTPSRWLVLSITLVVTARLLYGFWRAVTTWRMGVEGESWVVAAGVAGSMAAGAVVLGYYLVYWMGVRGRFRRHAVRPLRRM
jgi:hypothetical protein